MNTITFTCETITPMFLSGADGQTPELRPPSIKGALRFWWRAMNGHLDLSALKEQEAKIFGGSGEGQGRSKVIVSIQNHSQTEETMDTDAQALFVPHKPFMKKEAIKSKQKFEIVLRLIENSFFSAVQMQALFELTCLLGGLGKRARRGMGSVKITKYQIDEDITTYKMPDLEDIVTLLNTVNTTDRFNYNAISKVINASFGRTQKYPCIVQIEKGNPDVNILMKISNTTNKLHGQPNYGNELGKVMGGRFSSPIYVSVLPHDAPIITTLNTIPNSNVSVPNNNTALQKQFKTAIL